MRDDGQLILISGFIIAMGLVSLTMILNSVIYANNIAYEGTMDNHDKEILYLSDLTLKESNSSFDHDADSAKYIGHMNNYSKYVSQLYATQGGSVSVKTQLDNFSNKIATANISYSDGDTKCTYDINISKS
jgi:hypothetical protein